MSAATRERILNVVKELNFQPNLMAQSLKSGQTKTIGVIVPDLLSPFYPEFIRGIGGLCRQEGYSMILGDSNEDPKEEARYIRTFRARQVDGLIICSSGDNQSIYEEAQESDFPIVFADRLVANLEADMVLVNDYKGAYIATEHLIKLGHRMIGLIIPPVRSLSTRLERLAGYKQALSDYHIEVNEDFIKFVEPGNGEEALKGIEEFVKANRQLTAVFATNILLGLQLLKVIKAEKLMIPKDIAVVVFDEVPWGPLLDPPLTTVSHPALEQGEAAADMLLRKMKAKKSRRPKKVLIEPTLNVRESCGYLLKSGIRNSTV
jgi:DNA-binding LacI/PurR family transcriptional regulator